MSPPTPTSPTTTLLPPSPSPPITLAHTLTPTTFHLFPLLPPELQYMIWNHTLTPRLIYTTPSPTTRLTYAPCPPILHISRSVRTHFLTTHYHSFGPLHRSSATGKPVRPKALYFNPALDIYFPATDTAINRERGHPANDQIVETEDLIRMKRGVKTLMLTNIQAIDIVIGIESFASPDAPEGGVRELKADYPSLSKILLLLDEDEVEVDYRDEDICAWSGCDGLRTPGSGKVEEAMRAWTRSTRYTHQDVCCEWTWASFERFCGERGLGWEVVEGVWVEGGVGRGRRSERVRRKHCLFPGYIWSAGRIVDE